MLFKMVCNLKLMNSYFWNFSFNVYGMQLTETRESETADMWWGTTVHNALHYNYASGRIYKLLGNFHCFLRTFTYKLLKQKLIPVNLNIPIWTS